MTRPAQKGPHAMTKTRDDVVVSICIPDLPATDVAFARARAAAALLDARYRFREILIIASDDAQDAFMPLLSDVREVRLFTVGSAHSHYQKRLIIAEEAIGDVVVVTSASEIDQIDIVAMIERAAELNKIVWATRATSHTIRRVLAAPIIALGRVAGFKVNPIDLRTIAFPRTLLNALLGHSNPELALRFPPRDPRLPLSFLQVPHSVPYGDAGMGLGQRIELLQKLLVYVAPRLLGCVTLTSGLLTLAGFTYGAYAIAAWCVVVPLAPGWLTTSAMLSVSAVFMGLSILGISLALQQILSQNRKTSIDQEAHEITRVDLFGKVAADLNVDFRRGSDTSPKGRL